MKHARDAALLIFSAIVLAWQCCGCIHLGHVPGHMMALPPSSPERCRALSSRVLGLNLTSTISSALGAGGATGAGIFDGTARYVLVSGAAAFSLAAAITGYLATYSAGQFSRECPQ